MVVEAEDFPWSWVVGEVAVAVQSVMEAEVSEYFAAAVAAAITQEGLRDLVAVLVFIVIGGFRQITEVFLEELLRTSLPKGFFRPRFRCTAIY